jgi:hypothetical protein
MRTYPQVAAGTLLLPLEEEELLLFAWWKLVGIVFEGALTMGGGNRLGTLGVADEDEEDGLAEAPLLLVLLAALPVATSHELAISWLRSPSRSDHRLRSYLMLTSLLPPEVDVLEPLLLPEEEPLELLLLPVDSPPEKEEE